MFNASYSLCALYFVQIFLCTMFFVYYSLCTVYCTVFRVAQSERAKLEWMSKASVSAAEASASSAGDRVAQLRKLLNSEVPFPLVSELVYNVLK